MQRKFATSSLVTVIALVSLAALAPSCSSSDDSSGTNGGTGGATGGKGGTSGATGGAGGSTGGKGGTSGTTAGTGGTPAGGGGATAGTGGASAGTGGTPTGGTGGSAVSEGGDTGEAGAKSIGDITGATGSYTFDVAGNIQGWQSYSDSPGGVPRAPAPALTQSTEQYFGGTGSLKIDVSGWTDDFSGGAGAPDVAENAQASVQLNLPAIIPGKDVTFHIYMTTLTGLNYAQTFVQAKSDYSDFKSYPITLVAGWNTVHLVIPLDNPLPIVNIGLQFGLKSDYSAPIYIDEVKW